MVILTVTSSDFEQVTERAALLDLDIEYQHFNKLKPAFYKLITTIPI